MQIVTLDFETFWSKTHSLSKMLPMSYVMHPQTEIISCAIKVSDAETDVYFGEKDIRAALDRIDWANSLAIAHNMSGFDAMILAWRFDVRPKMWGCTLAMARPIHSIDVGNSLAKLVQHYGLGVKDNAVLLNTQGRNLKDFTAEERRQMETYNKADTDQCYALFHKLRKHYSAKEMWQIDATIRMLVEPRFLVDHELLEETLTKERQRKTEKVLELAEHLGLDVSEAQDLIEEEVTDQLASAAKFSAILEAQAVEVPMKPSPSNPDRQVPALAKTDQAFLDLQNHANGLVAAAARARLAIKSTILESRIESFLEVCDATEGWLPVPLNYAGAITTHRWSGWAYNPQNLPRIDPKNPKLSDALRMCMRAPDGYDVVVADLSGIELRVNMFLWKVPYAMELFKASPDKADLYRYFAAHDLYNIPEEEVSKNQRQVGKVCLAENSLILTRTNNSVSWVKIQDFSPEMQLWDGEEWVWAKGVVSNGWKKTQQLCGLSLTPDHLVLCGTQWLPAKFVSGEKTAQALATAAERLSLLVWWQSIASVSLRSSFGATVGFLSTRLKLTTSRLSRRLAATLVPSRQPGASGTGSTSRQCQKTNTAHDSLTAFPQRSTAATNRLTRRFTTTAVAALRSATSGAKTALRFFGMFARFLAGTTPPWSLTGLTLTATTPLGTSASPLGAKTCSTSAKSMSWSGESQSWNGETESLNRSLPVYDILDCGPRNRFTALTDRGPIIVHNCHLGLGFGAGAATFQKVAKLMGGVNISLDESQHLVTLYRAAHKEIANGWRECHRALQDIYEGVERPIDPWGLCWTEKDAIRLPSGRRIRYPGLHVETKDGKDEWWYGQGRFRARIYGPKVDENLVQSLARDAMADYSLTNFQRTGHRPALLVHDEWVGVVPKNESQKVLATLQSVMRTPLPWWPELVTWSEGDVADRYGQAK